jgi:hypothetical protein
MSLVQREGANMQDRDSRIRERAHRMWESEGRPEHQEKRHWEAAERAIEDEDRAAPRPVGAEDEDRASALKSAEGRTPVVGGTVPETEQRPATAIKAPPRRASRRRAAPPTPVDGAGAERPNRSV